MRNEYTVTDIPDLRLLAGMRNEYTVTDIPDLRLAGGNEERIYNDRYSRPQTAD
jgi:hypothetical protein